MNDPGRPTQTTLEYSKASGSKEKEEADLEAMARVGSTFYVIGSHSRDNEGKKQKGKTSLHGGFR